MNKYKLTTFIVVLLYVVGCGNDDSNEFEEVNSWIRDNMEENYLWNENVPSSVDGSIPTPAYFGSILDPEDFVSFIIDGVELVDDSSIDRSFTTGVSPSFGRFSNTNGVFIVVEYVYPGSPADSAGLSRGDIILAIDDTPLTTFNFESLFYADVSRIGYDMGVYNPAQNRIDPTGETIRVDQGAFEYNPVVYTSVIQEGSNNIGYMLLGEFVDGENDQFIDSVDVALQEFANEPITDLIIDLRYNSGGSFNAAKNLGNGIVESTAAQNEEVLVRFQYNDTIEQRIIDEEGPESENLVVKFSNDPDNLGLQRIYFLTSTATANTSELLINGLIPHMDVNIVGEPTNGQFYGTTIISGDTATPQNGYTIVPVNLQYENSEGSTGFVSGLQPDILIDDNLLLPFQIGNVNDPLLDAAIQNIISGSQTSLKGTPREYEVLTDKRAIRRGSILFGKEKN